MSEGAAPASLSGRLRPLVRKGLSNAELIASLPGDRPNMIRQIAVRLRRECGIDGTPGSGSRPFQMPGWIDDRLKQEALARSVDRYTLSANDMALKLLGAIVQDDLFDAILGEAGEA